MTTHAIGSPHSRLGAFSHTPFAVMWVATTCSFTGLAISDTASAWLMTSLNPDPRAVSLVQVASTLPMFLCTVPAGVKGGLEIDALHRRVLQTETNDSADFVFVHAALDGGNQNHCTTDLRQTIERP